MPAVTRLSFQTGWSATRAAGTSSNSSSFTARIAQTARASARTLSQTLRGHSGCGTSSPWPVTTATVTESPSRAWRAIVPPMPIVSSSAWGATTRTRRPPSAEDIFRRGGDGKRGLLDQERPDGQRVDASAPERPERVAGRADDCLPLHVERRVEEHGHARSLRETLEEPVVARVRVRIHGLRPYRPVHVDDGRDLLAGLRCGLESQDHERRRRRPLQEARGRRLGEARAEGTPVLAELDRRVDAVAGVHAPGIGEDRPAAQGARTAFEAPLEPAHDLARREQLRRVVGNVQAAAVGEAAALDLLLDVVVGPRRAEVEVL